MMLSHTGLIKLDTNYFQTHWRELVEEYLDAVPVLTISSESRTKAENRGLRAEKSELEIKSREIEAMKVEMEKIRQRLDVAGRFAKD